MATIRSLCALALLGAGCGGPVGDVGTDESDEAVQAANVTTYSLHVIWLEGEGTANRTELDTFIDYLLHHTNLAQYWGGGVALTRRGTWVVPAPAKIPNCGSPCRPNGMASWIDSLIQERRIPAPLAGTVPVYEVLINHNDTKATVLDHGAGGYNGHGVVDGVRAGIFYVTTTSDLYWHRRTPLANETSVTEHELAEAINSLRGGYGGGDIADGICEGWLDGKTYCRPGPFEGVGPTTFTTGSGCGDTVQGWLVQPLATSRDTWVRDSVSRARAPSTCSFHLKNVTATAVAGCHSGTLAQDVSSGTCVQGAGNGSWYHCDNGAWYAGETSCTTSYPWCDSATLGKAVPARTCVVSRFDHIEYQCVAGGAWKAPVVDGEGALGSCSAVYD